MNCLHIDVAALTDRSCECKSCHATATDESWFDESRKLVRFVRTWQLDTTPKTNP